MKQWDALWIHGNLATAVGGYGLLSDGAIGIVDGRIVWIGAMRDVPGKPESLAKIVHNCEGRLVTPGLIDCHTHAVFGSHRAHEFEMRLQGASYEDIARAGGGIRSSVQATRSLTEEELLQQSRRRILAMMQSGTTTVEIKSGYGLDEDHELKSLHVMKRLGRELPLHVHGTYLGAHSVPPEYSGRADTYLDHVCDTMVPKIARENLAEAVDVFCEGIAFSLAQTERVFKAAQKAGLAIHCHAEQLSDLGASALAARYGALSVDHLEYISDQSLAVLAKSETVAVMLPGAFYMLREKQLPPIARFRSLGIPMAIASDCNPGTSPLVSLPLAMNMGCTLFRMTPEECFLGVTAHAAKALGILQDRGTLEQGKRADFVLWDADHPHVLSYYVGYAPLHQVVIDGQTVSSLS